MQKQEPNSVQEYLSNRGRVAVASLWKNLDKQQRRERAAIPVYARQMKLYGKPKADEWLLDKFGFKRAKEMLQQDDFKRQITIYS